MATSPNTLDEPAILQKYPELGAYRPEELNDFYKEYLERCHEALVADDHPALDGILSSFKEIFAELMVRRIEYSLLIGNIQKHLYPVHLYVGGFFGLIPQHTIHLYEHELFE